MNPMLRSSTALTLVTVFCWTLLTGCGGQKPAEPEPPVAEPEPPFKLTKLAPPTALAAAEQAEFVARPVSFAGDLSGMVFEAARSLPEGASLDTATGTVTWTPTETQGPGQYPVSLRYWHQDHPETRDEVSYEVLVSEQNAPPVIEVPARVEVAAGKRLELPVKITDTDFPSNDIRVEIAGGNGQEVKYDSISGLLSWSVPGDWQQPQLAVTVRASDNGTPAGRSEKTLTIQITGIKTIRQPGPMDESYRAPNSYVDLPKVPVPELGKKADNVEGVDPVLVPIPEFNAGELSRPESLRLSLIVPDGLKDRYTVRYPGDGYRLFHVATNVPFELEPKSAKLPPQVIAECQLVDNDFRWTWALTKNSQVRGLQENLRECVVSVEDDGGQSLWLIALRPIEMLSNVSVSALFGDDELKQRLYRKPRTTVITPLVSKGLQLVRPGDFGAGIPCEARADDNWLILSLTDLSAVREIKQVELHILPYPDELGMKFVSEPSLETALKFAASSKKALGSLQASWNTWNRNLARAQADYAGALRLRVNSDAEQRLKTVKLNQAQGAINQAQGHLAKLSIDIPRAQVLAANQDAALKDLMGKLAPLRDYVLRGEICRTVSDVRVVVARLE